MGRFFEGVPGVFTEWEQEAARAYFTTFFPHYRIEASTREAIAGLLARDDLGPMLRRMLVEEDDTIARALACRAFAAPDPPVDDAAGEPAEPPVEEAGEADDTGGSAEAS